MSLLLAISLWLPLVGGPGAPPASPRLLERGAEQLAPCPRAVTCRWECICFRVNGYRCFRYYTEPCEGKACWQCQSALTQKARKSCSIGNPIRSCFCRYNQIRKGMQSRFSP